MVTFRRERISNQKIDLLKISAYKNEIRQYNEELQRFANRKNYEYFVHEPEFLKLNNLNLLKRAIVQIVMKIDATIWGNLITAVADLSYTYMTPKMALFEPLKELGVYNIQMDTHEFKINGNMLIVEGEQERQLIEKKQVKISRHMGDYYLMKFIDENIGAFAILYNHFPKETRKLIKYWKAISWNKNYKENFKAGKRNITYYERPIAPKQFRTLYKKFMKSIYFSVLDMVLNDNWNNEKIEGLVIAEELARNNKIIWQDIYRWDTLDSEKLGKYFSRDKHIRYKLYSKVIESVKNGVDTWQKSQE